MDVEPLTVRLDEIEAELDRLGLLALAEQPIPEVTSAFGFADMAFEQWLVGVFLPNARAAIESRQLPADSQVGVAAMRHFDGEPDAERLVSLLSNFDAGIRAHARRQGRVQAAASGSGWLRRLLGRLGR